MKIYQHHPVTKELIGHRTAHVDPLSSKEAGEPVYLVPAHSTTISPPDIALKEAAIFNINTQSWDVVADYRNDTWYNTNTKLPFEIKDLGQPPSWLTPIQPQAYDEWVGGAWMHDPGLALKSVKKNKTDQLAIIADNKIASEFTSAALGDSFIYRNAMADQINLIGVVMAGIDVVLACRNSGGIWALRPHTAKQAQQVLLDCVARSQSIEIIKRALQDVIDATDDVEDALDIEIKIDV